MKAIDLATIESSRGRVAESDFDPPIDAKTAWQPPDPSVRQVRHQPREGGNVTGNEGFLAPS